jgi:hypothetical protein
LKGAEEKVMSERRVLRGFLANIEMLPPLIVTFPFNPTSISDNKSVKYADKDGKKGSAGEGPGKLYRGGGDRTISFSFHLHGLEEGTNALNPSGLDNGISTELAKLRSFLYPKQDAWAAFTLPGKKKGKTIEAPPTCYFGFGTRILECQVTELTINETQFNSFLAPVRADVSITLTVIEEGSLYEIDKQHRNLLAALGLQNIRIF